MQPFRNTLGPRLRSADPSRTHSSVSAAPAFGAIQIAAMGAQALECRISRTRQMVALAAKEGPIRTAVQTDHEPEVVALGAVGASHRENHVLPDLRAHLFHMSWPHHARSKHDQRECRQHTHRLLICY